MHIYAIIVSVLAATSHHFEAFFNRIVSSLKRREIVVCWIWFRALQSFYFGAVVVLNLYLRLLINLVYLVKSMIQILLERVVFLADGEAACTWHSAVLATGSAAAFIMTPHVDRFFINIKPRTGGDVSRNRLFFLVKLILLFINFRHKLLQAVINLM